tara:strand:- start:16 stop:1182 length:1167 start_codon:yes stop_codon:yes gene_type:complete
LEVRQIPITEINPAPYNPRKNLKPGDPDYEALKRSVDRWGLVEPLVWNQTSKTLVGGHQRLKVLKDMGAETATVTVVHLDDQDEAALNVALNKISGDWDTKRLADLLSDLDANGYDATLTGFDVRELEELLVDKPSADDPAPEPPANPKSKVGEVYLLGKHRLMCGDATNKEHVKKLLGDVKPHLMVTDPPYGVEYDPNWRNEAAAKGTIGYGATAVGQVQNDDRADWSEAWELFPGQVAYVWHAGNLAHVVAGSLQQAGFQVRAQVIWAKPRHVISRGHYHGQHEPCWYAVRKGHKGHWCGSRKESTLWQINHSRSETGHGTQKPLEAMRRPILNNSSPGQAVYDPFGGSGTTLIAAEETSRVCYMMELDPGYCDVIRERYEAITNA